MEKRCGWLLVLGVLFLLSVPALADEGGVKKTAAQQATKVMSTLKELGLSGGVQMLSINGDNLTDFNDESAGAVDSDSFGSIVTRIRVAWDLAVSDDTSAKVEVQNINVSGDGADFRNTGSADDENDLELYQGYAQIKGLGGTEVNLKAGRQELVYGGEMLLGDADFYGGLSHDALKLNWARENYWVDFFWSKLSEGNAARTGTSGGLTGDIGTLAGAPPDKDLDLWGLYGSVKVNPDWNLDAYALKNRDRRVGPGDDERLTYGARLAGTAMGNLGASAEVALQTGDVDVPPGPGVLGQGDIDARAYEINVHWDFKDQQYSPRLGVMFANASGDEDDDDEDVETFNPLFGDSHHRYGNSDLFTLTNLDYWGIYVTASHEKWSGGFKWNMYEADKGDDTTGGAGGTVITTRGTVGTATSETRDEDVGDGWDAWVGYNYSDAVNFLLNFSMLSPDDFIEQSFAPLNTETSDDDAWRLYVQMQLKF